MLETYFGLAYMLESDTTDRGMAFLVWHIHKKIKSIERYDSTTEMGKQFRKKLSNDKLTNNVKLLDDPQLKAKKDSLESLLQEAEYISAEREYQRLIAQKETNPAWYRLFNGPRNVEELANRLKLMAIYEVVYRDWSSPTHGTDILHGKASVTPGGTTEIFQIRHFGDVQDVAKWILTLSLMMFSLYIDNRIPERKTDYLVWYQTIREAYLRITDPEPLIIVS